jgi:hypothetical protein
LDYGKVSKRASPRGDDYAKEDDKEKILKAVTAGYVNHLLEGEYADTMTQSLEAAYDKDASQGMYIHAPKGTGNYYSPGTAMALYSVYITQPGEYVLWGRVRALDGRADSFFVQIDNGANNVWNFKPGDTWHWSQVKNQKREMPVKFSLAEGLHTIKVKVREDGAKLDKLLLTNNVKFVLGGSGKKGRK